MGGVLHAGGGEILDRALLERHVLGFVIQDVDAVGFRVFVGDVQLSVGHVDTGDGAGCADERGGDVAVAAASRAEVEDAEAVDALRRRGSAAVVLSLDLVRDVRENVADLFREVVRCAARGGLEVIRGLEGLAVVLADAGSDGVVAAAVGGDDLGPHEGVQGAGR